jgi:hypothetical protein
VSIKSLRTALRRLTAADSHCCRGCGPVALTLDGEPPPPQCPVCGCPKTIINIVEEIIVAGQRDDPHAGSEDAMPDRGEMISGEQDQR